MQNIMKCVKTYFILSYTLLMLLWPLLPIRAETVIFVEEKYTNNYENNLVEPVMVENKAKIIIQKKYTNIAQKFVK